MPRWLSQGGLGALIGGLATGTIADLYGYPALLTTLAVVLAIWPLTALLLEDTTKNPVPSLRKAGVRATNYGLGIILLLIANLTAEIAFFVGRLGTSLEMNRLGFVSAQISGTVAVGAIVGIPLTAMLGSLSDKVNRKLLLGLCFLSTLTALLALTEAVELWQFFVVSSLLSIFAYAGAGVGSALVADLV